MRNVYLCHKCLGALADPRDSGLYGCSCISGYVRDWQTPITLDAARKAQAENKEKMAKWRAERDAKKEYYK